MWRRELLVSGAIALLVLNPTLAQSEPTSARAAPPSASEARLSPGGAAGITQAQGAQRNRIRDLLPFGIVGGLALLVVLATGGDEDSAVTTTGTN